MTTLLIASADSAAAGDCRGRDCQAPERAPRPRAAAAPPRAYVPPQRAYVPPQRPNVGSQPPPARFHGPATSAHVVVTNAGSALAYSPTRQFSYRGRSMAAARAAPYRYHRGYAYQRYRLGERFPLALLIAPYFIADYALFDLASPGPGLEWVRYGPDALLVNTYTGQVVDVAYGVFDEDPQYAGGDPSAYPPPGAAPAGYPPPPLDGPGYDYPPPPPPPPGPQY